MLKKIAFILLIIGSLQAQTYYTLNDYSDNTTRGYRSGTATIPVGSTSAIIVISKTGGLGSAGILNLGVKSYTDTISVGFANYWKSTIGIESTYTVLDSMKSTSAIIDNWNIGSDSAYMREAPGIAIKFLSIGSMSEAQTIYWFIGVK